MLLFNWHRAFPLPEVRDRASLPGPLRRGFGSKSGCVAPVPGVLRRLNQRWTDRSPLTGFTQIAWRCGLGDSAPLHQEPRHRLRATA
jgi:hypothetical protein